MLFFVTTSPCRDWVICAPAAFLGSSSRFSGSFSGIKPWFSVTRYHHGSPLYYHRKLIGQKFEWTIVGTKDHTIRKVIMIHHMLTSSEELHWFLYLINTSLLSKELGFYACISSRFTTVIQVVKKKDHQINYNWFNEPFAVSQYKCLYLDMHGLVFKTSIWLLAGSTR